MKPHKPEQYVFKQILSSQEILNKWLNMTVEAPSLSHNPQ